MSKLEQIRAIVSDLQRELTDTSDPTLEPLEHKVAALEGRLATVETKLDQALADLAVIIESQVVLHRVMQEYKPKPPTESGSLASNSAPASPLRRSKPATSPFGSPQTPEAYVNPVYRSPFNSSPRPVSSPFDRARPKVSGNARPVSYPFNSSQN